MKLLDHLLALAFGLVLPVLQAWGSSGEAEDSAATEPQPQTTAEKRGAYWSTAFAHTVFGGMTLGVWYLGGRSFSELGLTEAPTNLGSALALTLLYFAVYGADTYEKLRPSKLEESRARCRREAPHMPVNRIEVLHTLPAIAAAAVWEEVLFRGFLIAYVGHFTGSSTLGVAAAVVLPAISFGVLHLNQEPRAVAMCVVLAIIVGVILVVTGSLWIPIAIHFVVNLIAMSMGPWLMREPDGA
ncbi:hypothetical protein ABI59_13645 [Acidobacteria bacterium Mor1]|nr:hypothetical protein ABI59_13645 [Acidobacteria bacterium Mor1]